MKKYYKFFVFIFLQFCFTSLGRAQIVNIPDANFKAALLAHSPVINTNGDSEIQVSEAAAFSGTMTVSSKNISSLIGIAAFTSLTSLYCNYNQISSLNLTFNSALVNLDCNSNHLSSLNITNNTALVYLSCGFNMIFSLNTTTNTSLSYLFCTVCSSYIAPDGQVYTSSGVYSATIPNAMGCDSVISINLTVNLVNTGLSVFDPVITSNLSGGTYQWLDCSNSFAEIPGETNQSFTAVSNGQYAVLIGENGCTDTSVCILISNLKLSENNLNERITLFPNPSDGSFYIDFGRICGQVFLQITDIQGREVSQQTISNKQLVNLNLDEPTGIYFVKLIINETESKTIKLLKK